MIRRTPTIIPMTDNDVQDVRDMVAQQKAEIAHEKEMAEKMKKLADVPDMQSEDFSMLEEMKQAKAKQQEKERRLGIQTCKKDDTSNTILYMFRRYAVGVE
ncbi:hypothetical protein Moror_6790 [Moniliophthora roreri MCA 2997]|uniref:Uncharacterized protein n=1 Tax=Moniliophthora roreri (strain MCA 2997) TaxID=1381753 RepID=V2XVI1_MONRO|nr:hypothetical protein Moror_6790 [Moniliophthora roreri MCA 2997]